MKEKEPTPEFWLSCAVVLLLLLPLTQFFETPPDEGGFLIAMEKEFPGSNKEYNLDIGKNVCFKLESGKTVEEVVMEKFDHGMSITNASMVTQISIDYLCKDEK